MNTTRARESFVVVVVARTRIIEKERERERERFYLRDEKDALNPGVASRRTTTTTTTTKETFPRVALLRGVGDFPPEEEEEEEDESPL